jgi:hypothetical protein
MLKETQYCFDSARKSDYKTLPWLDETMKIRRLQNKAPSIIIEVAGARRLCGTIYSDSHERERLRILGLSAFQYTSLICV